MNAFPWILVSIVAGLVILALLMVVVIRRRKEPRRVDYRNYFVMGVIWLVFAPIMILLPWILHREEPSLAFSFFFVMGIAYVIIGLPNRDKWGKQVEAPPATRKKTMVVLGLALLIGALVALLFAIRF